MNLTRALGCASITTTSFSTPSSPYLLTCLAGSPASLFFLLVWMLRLLAMTFHLLHSFPTRGGGIIQRRASKDAGHLDAMDTFGKPGKIRLPPGDLMPQSIFIWGNYSASLAGGWHTPFASFSDTFRAGFLAIHDA